MARRRMIDPSIWQDEEFGSLSSMGKVLFIGLFSNADDEGRIRANAAYLKSTIFMYDDLTIEEIEILRSQVIKHISAVQFYKVDGKAYIQLKNWNEYQKQHKDRVQASTLPSYIEEASGIHESDDSNVSDNVGQLSDNDGVSKGKLSQVSLVKVKSSKDNTGASLPEKETSNALDNRPLGAGPLAADLKARYNFSVPAEKSKGISTAHQAKAFEYAEKLNIELKGPDTGRWIKIFKQAAEGRKSANLEAAYSYCVDHSEWDMMSNDAKMNMIFFIYENGLDKKNG